MTTDFQHEREDVLDAVCRIVASGLVSGSSGNVSRRIRTPDGDLIAITASRVAYHRMKVDDIVVVDLEVEPIWGSGVPSSESLTHLAVYAARPDVGAVIHTHSVYASAFAVAGQAIPPMIDEQVVTLGGAIEVAEYGASASERLAGNAVTALGDRAAVLLRSHGALGVGADLDEAIAVVELIERIAKIRAVSLQLGDSNGLPAEIVAAEQAAYRMMKGFR